MLDWILSILHEGTTKHQWKGWISPILQTSGGAPQPWGWRVVTNWFFFRVEIDSGTQPTRSPPTYINTHISIQIYVLWFVFFLHLIGIAWKKCIVNPRQVIYLLSCGHTVCNTCVLMTVLHSPNRDISKPHICESCMTPNGNLPVVYVFLLFFFVNTHCSKK